MGRKCSKKLFKFSFYTYERTNPCHTNEYVMLQWVELGGMRMCRAGAPRCMRTLSMTIWRWRCGDIHTCTQTCTHTHAHIHPRTRVNTRRHTRTLSHTDAHCIHPYTNTHNKDMDIECGDMQL